MRIVLLILFVAAVFPAGGTIEFFAKFAPDVVDKPAIVAVPQLIMVELALGFAVLVAAVCASGLAIADAVRRGRRSEREAADFSRQARIAGSVADTALAVR